MSTSIFQAVDIFYAISHNKRKAVNAWVKSSPNASIRDDQGQSVLHAAVLTGDRSMVQKMLKTHVDVNMLDKAGKTALDYGVDHGNKKIILELLNHKAQVTTMGNVDQIKMIIDGWQKHSKLWLGLGLSFIVLAVCSIFSPTFIWIALSCWECSPSATALFVASNVLIYGLPAYACLKTHKNSCDVAQKLYEQELILVKN